jgi:hypothetical protein
LGPPVDFGKVSERLCSPTARLGAPEVLGIVAGWTESDHSDEPLCPCSFVVLPHLVSLYGDSRADPATYLASVASTPVGLLLHGVPAFALQELVEIRSPLFLGE